MGALLAPSLAAAYLAQIGDTGVKAEPGAAPGETRVVGQRGDQREIIVVASSTAAAGFKLLGSGGAEVVLAARRILPAEKDSLASLGDLSSPAAEHVLALDALAVIVNPANPVTILTKDQIRGVFTGTIRDWSALGGPPGPVTVYALEPQTDAGTEFASLALGGGVLSPTAKPLPDGRQVSQAVIADPHGIGVVDLPNILQAHALPIGETGSSPSSPTNLAAVASEDYPLTYRLYLYTSPKAAGGIAQRFVEFATGPDGQAIAQQQGLASLSAKPAAPAAPAAPATPTDRLKQIVQGGKKLAVDFRFNPNSSDLDLKGSRDIDRVTNYLLSMHYTGEHLILVGFADNQGNPESNVAVSKKRADALAAMFAQRGLPPAKVVGFGADLPLADNTTEEGRQKNRRVEVYILP
jgi:phosphate transport system substrate-binding protein